MIEEHNDTKINNENEDLAIDILNHDDLEDEICTSPEGISSYSTSISIDSLIPRLQKKHYYIPPFQREYVWTETQASRLIESIFLGLPIPSIFLGQDSDSKKYFVIDGQQRLISLLKFFNNEIKLKGINKKWNGKLYSELEEDEQFQLGDFAIHAIIVKEDSSTINDSIYQIFERINTGGVKLQAQEIRASSYHGKFNNLLNNLANNEKWDNFIQLNKSRQKPQELILRFFALYYEYETYKPTIKTFMNLFMKTNRNFEKYSQQEMENLFNKTVDILTSSFEKKDFILKPSKVINTQLLDSVMVGIAHNIDNKNLSDNLKNKEVYEKLKNDINFIKFCNSRKSTKELVLGRIEETIKAFGY